VETLNAIIDPNSPIWVLLIISPLVLCLVIYILIKTHGGLRQWDERISEKAAAHIGNWIAVTMRPVVLGAWKVFPVLWKIFLFAVMVAVSAFIVLGIAGLLLFGIRQFH
jgi:hypothetical protein